MLVYAPCHQVQRALPPFAFHLSPDANHHFITLVMENHMEVHSLEELKEQLRELEHSYAELLGDGAGPGLLRSLHKEIKAIQSEMQRRRQPTSP